MERLYRSSRTVSNPATDAIFRGIERGSRSYPQLLSKKEPGLKMQARRLSLFNRSDLVFPIGVEHQIAEAFLR